MLIPKDEVDVVLATLELGCLLSRCRFSRGLYLYDVVSTGHFNKIN